MIAIKCVKFRDGIFYRIYRDGREYDRGIAPSQDFLIGRVAKDFRISKKKIKIL